MAGMSQLLFIGAGNSRWWREWLDKLTNFLATPKQNVVVVRTSGQVLISSPDAMANGKWQTWKMDIIRPHPI